jgi:hypothetical protein
MKAAPFHSNFILYCGGVLQRHALRNRRTRAYGGALRAYDKNRRHPIPVSLPLGQYCAVNLAEAGDVRR